MIDTFNLSTRHAGRLKMLPIATRHARSTDPLTLLKRNTPKRSRSWQMYVNPCGRLRRTTRPKERNKENSNSISTKTLRRLPMMRRGVDRRHPGVRMPTRARNNGIRAAISNGPGIHLVAHRPKKLVRGSQRRNLLLAPSHHTARGPREGVLIDRRITIIISSNSSNRPLSSHLMEAIIIRFWDCLTRHQVQRLRRLIIKWRSNTIPIKIQMRAPQTFFGV
mmetsp:Transcript_10666/g.18744  ORF Transcript_10666/g.18744 Transcript_10666/m.18744 type:complete len:221 (+) Transcript_10666:990-1652(+)